VTATNCSRWGARGLGIAALVALAMVLAPAVPATVPPKNCGKLSVSGKRYQIKADQIRCTTAKTYSRRYLRSHSRPSGYRCNNYGAYTKLKFRCSKGVRIFFAIRR
jgi:hypothetical protein